MFEKFAVSVLFAVMVKVTIPVPETLTILPVPVHPVKILPCAAVAVHGPIDVPDRYVPLEHDTVPEPTPDVSTVNV